MTIRTPSEDHAIKSMAFAVEFRELVSGPALRAFKEKLAEQVSKTLPKRSEKQSVTFSFDSEAGSTKPATTDLAGVSFSRIEPDGTVHQAFSLEGKSMFVANNFYTSWTEAFAQARELLLQGFDAIKEFVELKSIALQYNDEFRSDISLEEFDPSILFEKKTIYLPAGVFARRGPWHCHQGFTVDDGKQLINLNTTLEGDGTGVLIKTLSSHRVQISIRALEKDQAVEAEPGVFVSDDGMLPVFQNSIDTHFPRMHRANKELFMGLLTCEIQQQIGL